MNAIGNDIYIGMLLWGAEQEMFGLYVNLHTPFVVAAVNRCDDCCVSWWRQLVVIGLRW